MVSVKVVAFAALAALIGSAAQAADMPQMLPPMPLPPIEETGGWYLRGDIGMSNQRLKNLDNTLFATAQQFEFLDKGGFDSAPFVGVGLGYAWNSWLRTDATIEYRGNANFHALDRFFNPDAGGYIDSNNYSASKSEWLGLLNGYADLGTWGGVTPFIGAGVGFSRVTISHFRDLNIPAAGMVPPTGVAYADEGVKWNLAWALYAGVGYKINPKTTLEFAYRYVSLGDGQSGDLISYSGGNSSDNPMIFKGLSSHDLKFGLRYTFN
jgi:opacity protein-like surface antigen